MREGRSVLSVLVRNEPERERIADILDELDPIEFTGMADAPMRDTRTAAPLPGAGTVSGERGSLGPGQQEEQVIPVVKEELAVGKRASERRYRIHTYAVETPVEKEVTLRDERVVIERRPVSGDREIGRADIPQEREYEVIERHEEPIVEKRARNAEEVVVRREANERTQTVRDTVRETQVDVENEAGGLAEDRERNLPNRTP